MLHSEAESRQADDSLILISSYFNAHQKRSILALSKTPSPPVHADLDAMNPEFSCKHHAGESASLIRIKNLRLSVEIYCRF